MQVQTKKKVPWILLCGVVVLACLAVLVAGLLRFFSRSYQLHLPDYNNLKGVTLTHNGGEEVELQGAYAEDVLFILTGNGRTTNEESIEDAPVNVDDWIKVDFHFTGGGTSTLFVYHHSRTDGEYFIEQPYNGIYQISGDEYNSIEKYTRNA